LEGDAKEEGEEDNIDRAEPGSDKGSQKAAEEVPAEEKETEPLDSKDMAY